MPKKHIEFVTSPKLYCITAGVHIITYDFGAGIIIIN